MPTLPQATDDAGWDALCDDDAALAAGVRTILARHGLAGEPVQRFDSGSLPVYAVGEHHVLKLFPPNEVAHADTEARVLAALQDALPIPTPRLHAFEAQDGWPCVLMSRLRGERLVHAWPALSAAERDRAADTLGETVCALHAIDISALSELTPRWSDFIPVQRASAAQRQRERRLAPEWIERIEPFLERWMPPPAPRLALLHTELMREHLTVDDGRVSGLFDFEPAMIGAPEYDFASFGLFVACGDARFLHRALRAYGHAEDALDETLQYRLMAYALLHRYSNLRWYFERLPAPDAGTLEALARRWWAL
jgi:hygromycin-B 7''-O-kinase